VSFRSECLPFIVQGDTTSERLNSVGLVQFGVHATDASHLLRPLDAEVLQGVHRHDDHSARGRGVDGGLGSPTNCLVTDLCLLYLFDNLRHAWSRGRLNVPLE
jgi:hypothetical protein